MLARPGTVSGKCVCPRGLDLRTRLRNPLRVTSSGTVRWLLGTAAACAALTGLSSCGSRTGLFGPERTLDGGTKDVIVEASSCVPGTFRFALARPNLMFVLDRSASMALPLDGSSTRWQVLEVALAGAITSFDTEIAMGARFYPAEDSGNIFGPLNCGQDTASKAITPAVGNASKILDVFAATEPFGNTPTADALTRAVEDISNSRAIANAIVLATDGAPNCNTQLDRETCECSSPDGCTEGSKLSTNCLDDARTIQTITGIVDGRKIPVYVIGIGVVSPFDRTIDAMALAGRRPRSGSPRYYPGDTPELLSEAFTTIRDSVAKCSYVTSSVPTNPDAISVEVRGERIPRDLAHIDGWDWIDQASGQLQLFGSACERATPDEVTGTVRCEQ